MGATAPRNRRAAQPHPPSPTPRNRVARLPRCSAPRNPNRTPCNRAAAPAMQRPAQPCRNGTRDTPPRAPPPGPTPRTPHPAAGPDSYRTYP
ncbi:hypothetical protein SHKM778_72280 [Streptomyces sp. KM77-8]|uniref:Uncharacterized protein n=1 Tax=Streptomyces haneummycinicus TaxID=3074435 RepID=A0AAT9HTX9_9ACTN